VTIVLDGWEVAVTRFEKKIGPFTIGVQPVEINGFRWLVEASNIPNFTSAHGTATHLEEAKATAERVAGLLGGLVAP
jgi:hypothetical protein